MARHIPKNDGAKLLWEFDQHLFFVKSVFTGILKSYFPDDTAKVLQLSEITDAILCNAHREADIEFRKLNQRQPFNLKWS